MVRRRRNRLGRFVKSGHKRRTHRRNPVEVLAVNPRPRRRVHKYARRVVRRNPVRRVRRVMHRRVTHRRRYARPRMNPAELMELAALNPLGAKKKRAIGKALHAGWPMRKITHKYHVKAKTVRRHSYKVARRATYKSLKSAATYRRKHHKMRNRYTIPFRVPKSAHAGKLMVAFNPAWSFKTMKESAMVGAYTIVGFAGASFLTNLVSNKVTAVQKLAIGPFQSKSIVSTIIAAVLPFVPLHFKGKDNVIAGAWVAAFANLLKDILPAGSAIAGYLPVMGDFTQYVPQGYYQRVPAFPDTGTSSYFIPNQEGGGQTGYGNEAGSHSPDYVESENPEMGDAGYYSTSYYDQGDGTSYYGS